jgi:hypothetical protein
MFAGKTRVSQASFDLIHQQRYGTHPELLASPQLLIRHAVTHTMPTNAEGTRPTIKTGLRGGRKAKLDGVEVDRLAQPPPPLLDECLNSFCPMLHGVLEDLRLVDKDQAVIAPLPSSMAPVLDKAIAQVNVSDVYMRVPVPALHT